MDNINFKKEFKEFYCTEIANNIRKYRKENHITQAVLAERMDVSHEFIRRIESQKGRKSFSLETVYKAAIALNVSPSKIFDVDLENLKKYCDFES